jgi:hypothetical protein
MWKKRKGALRLLVNVILSKGVDDGKDCERDNHSGSKAR